MGSETEHQAWRYNDLNKKAGGTKSIQKTLPLDQTKKCESNQTVALHREHRMDWAHETPETTSGQGFNATEYGHKWKARICNNFRFLSGQRMGAVMKTEA